jgi:tellurium resistance protein TerD
MRGKDVFQEVEQWLEVGSGANLRDMTAVKRLAGGFFKILFPHKEVTATEFEQYCLRPAIRLRQKVRDELHLKSNEFAPTVAPVAVRGDLPPDALLPVVEMERRIAVPAAQALTRGANTALGQVAPNITEFRITLEWDAPASSMGVDGSVFMLAADAKVRSDADFIFYNQPASPCGGVRFEPGRGGGASQTAFALELRRIPPDVARLVVALTIYDGPLLGVHFGQVARTAMRLFVAESGREVLSFELPRAEGQEAAMLVCELYRHASGWKIRALGQGFNDGLARMAETFGIEVI